MDYEIIIGGRRLGLLDSVTIRRSVETLGASAGIKLPATCLNKTLNAEQFLHEGDFIDISLGYDNSLKTEFNGWLKSVKTDDNSITIECEDDIYLWRVELNDEQLHAITLTALLQKIALQVSAANANPFNVLCDYQFTYDKFTISHATAIDVLKKVQEETKANIYFDGTTLHIHPPYTHLAGNTVIYDFARNVQQSSLKYVTAKDKKIKVTIETTLPDGKIIKAETGMSGGQTITRRVSASAINDLKTIADSEFNMLCYDGYEGDLTGWLVPFCQPGDLVTVKDADYPTKTGTYYVIATEVSFSSNGGQRKVTLGRRMA
ncbi:MAG: hypothetical protein IJU35_01445 [Paludibacteraceae bacterium]|nr:hypothetical protein [Paludibacteraceae bacterium]